MFMDNEWICYIACFMCAGIGVVIGFVWGEANTYNRWWGKGS